MSKVKTIVELRDEQNKLEARKNAIISNLGTEGRKLNDGESEELRTLAMKTAELDFEIALAEARNKREPHRSHQTQDDVKKYSLIRSIREIVSGNMSEETRELNRMGEAQFKECGLSGTGQLFIPSRRGNVIQATVTGDGKEAVPEDLLNIMGPLRDRLVLVQAGANFLTGLNGNIVFPDYTGSTAQWEGEVAKAKNGKGTFGKKTMTPKRIASVVEVSKQFLQQESVGAENMLRNDLVDAVATKLQSTIFGKHAHVDTMPDGFFTGTPTFVTSGVGSYDGVVDLEMAVDVNNALEGNLAYIMHTKGRGVLKKTLRALNVAEGFIWNNNTVNGYNALTTTGVASELGDASDEYGIVFGNWADLIIGQWGAIDLTIDATTKAEDAIVRLIINSYFDVLPRRASSFAVGSLK